MDSRSRPDGTSDRLSTVGSGGGVIPAAQFLGLSPVAALSQNIQVGEPPQAWVSQGHDRQPHSLARHGCDPMLLRQRRYPLRPSDRRSAAQLFQDRRASVGDGDGRGGSDRVVQPSAARRCAAPDPGRDPAWARSRAAPRSPRPGIGVLLRVYVFAGMADRAGLDGARQLSKVRAEDGAPQDRRPG